LNVHSDGPVVYFLHFASKTSKWTIDDLHDSAFESLMMMFSHATIRFLYGPRFAGAGSTASIIATKSAISHTGQSRQRRGDAKALMDAAKVVVHVLERDRHQHESPAARRHGMLMPGATFGVSATGATSGCG
jgi:hypothetical protein